MPSYDYRCHTCDGTFEVTRSVHDDAPSEMACPCGHTDTTRVFAAVGMAAGASTGGGRREPAAGCCGGGCCG